MAYSIHSFTVFAGELLGTNMMLGALPTWAMGVKSRTVSYGSLAPMAGPMEWVLVVVNSKVWPSRSRLGRHV